MNSKLIIALLTLVAVSGWAVVIQLFYLNRRGAGTVLVLSQRQASELSKLLQQPDVSSKTVVELSNANLAILGDAQANLLIPSAILMDEPSPTTPPTQGATSSAPAKVSLEFSAERDLRSNAEATSSTHFGSARPEATSSQRNTLGGTTLRASSTTSALKTLPKSSSTPLPVSTSSSSITTPTPGRTSAAENPASSVVLATDRRGPMDAAESVELVSPLNTTVHVCICSDDPDFRPTIAAIRSAMTSSASPHRLLFHFITTPELHKFFAAMSQQFLRDVRLEVHSDAKLQQIIQDRLAKAAARARGTRKALLSTFNFAPFYLPQFLSRSPNFDASITGNIIYLDGDVLSFGDLAALHDQELDDLPCAAVPYCHQRLEDYVDFKLLASLDITDIDPKTCIANRGLMVVNLRVWQDMRITEMIEQWLQRFGDLENPLWSGGMSQPPWLLALNGKYLHLGQEWNCNGLAREGMVKNEADALRQEGLTSTHFKQLAVEEINSGIEPYVATCSREGKLLHFNGGMKPWLIADGETRVPVCELPEDLQLAQANFSWMQHFSMSGGNDMARNFTFVRCADIFWQFVEKRPPQYFSQQAESREMRDRLQDAVYFANRLRQVREQRISEAISRQRNEQQENRRQAVLARAGPNDARIREEQLKEILAGGFKRSMMVVTTRNITVNGAVVVKVGGKGMVVDKVRKRRMCTDKKDCADPTDSSRLLCWFRKREDKKHRPIEVLAEEIRKLSKDETTKSDLSWKYRHLQY